MHAWQLLSACMGTHTLYLYTHAPWKLPSERMAGIRPHIWLLWGLHGWAARESERDVLEESIYTT